jgi:RNA polymerase sigma factor (sigma-70 family)
MSRTMLPSDNPFLKVPVRFYSREEEAELCRRKDAGDLEAKAQLLSSVTPLLIRIVRHYCRRFRADENLVDDCIQAVMLEIWKRIDAFDASHRLTTWVFQPAMWAVRDCVFASAGVLRRPKYLAQTKVREKMLARESFDRCQVIHCMRAATGELAFVAERALPDWLADETDEEIVARRQRVAQRVCWCLSQLDERERTILRGRYLEDLSLKELAAQIARMENKPRPLTKERIRQLQERAEQRFSLLWESPQAPYAGTKQCTPFSPSLGTRKAG